MNILTKFREIRESRQNIFNSAKVLGIISLLFLFPRQLSRQKSISYKYFCEIFQKNKKFSRKSGKFSCHQIIYTKMKPLFPMLQTSLAFLLNWRKRQHVFIGENVRLDVREIKHHFSTIQLGPNTTDYHPFFSSLQKTKVRPEVFVLAFHVWCFLWTHEIFGTLGVVGLPKTNGQLQNAERNADSSMKGINFKKKADFNSAAT
jgi:hypothetical protein